MRHVLHNSNNFSYISVIGNLISLPAVTAALMAPSKYPGCSGTRNLHDNLSDLRAQVAANQKVWSLYRRFKLRRYRGSAGFTSNHFYCIPFLDIFLLCDVGYKPGPRINERVWFRSRPSIHGVHSGVVSFDYENISEYFSGK